MKFRTICAMCAAAVLAFGASSCNKDKGNTSFTLNVPETIVDDERAYVDISAGGAFRWNGGDEMMVYNLDYTDGTQSVKEVFTCPASAEGHAGTTFSGNNVGAKKDGIFFFYPANRAVGTLDADNRETFEVAAEQTYTLINNVGTVDVNSLSMAAGPFNEVKSSFTMQHIFGILRLKLTGTKTVTSIEVTDPNRNLYGHASLKLHNVNTTQLSAALEYFGNGTHPGELGPYASYIQNDLGWNVIDGGNTVTLNCGTGVQLKSTVTPFYITLRPGALVNGFSITVNYSDSTSQTFTNADLTGDAHTWMIRNGYFKTITYALD